MRNLLITLTLLISFLSFGQDYNKDALKICSVLQSNSFASNNAAQSALDKILGVIGASKNFVLQPCANTNNATATSYKGIRYILYDSDFMNSLSSGDNWGNLFILAHEVGHHINGHSLDLVLYAIDAVESVSLAQSREQELEADEFAGFVLAKLGGPLSAANQMISKTSDDYDDTYNTHPNRNKRLYAVSKGFNNANITNIELKQNLSEEYYYKALEDINSDNYAEAFNNITVAIALNKNNYSYYSLKGDILGFQSKYFDAISSYKKGIELNENSYWLYSALGHIYNIIGSEKNNGFNEELTLSKKYFNKAIEKSPEPLVSANTVLGVISFEYEKDYEAAINFLNKSLEIEKSDKAFFYRAMSYGFNGDNYKAISGFTDLIEFTQDIDNKAQAYYFRGFGKGQIGDDEGYCEDLRAAFNLVPKDNYKDDSCN